MQGSISSCFLFDNVGLQFGGAMFMSGSWTLHLAEFSYNVASESMLPTEEVKIFRSHGKKYTCMLLHVPFLTWPPPSLPTHE